MHSCHLQFQVLYGCSLPLMMPACNYLTLIMDHHCKLVRPGDMAANRTSSHRYKLLADACVPAMHMVSPHNLLFTLASRGQHMCYLCNQLYVLGKKGGGCFRCLHW
jgi:hypothetical protein